MRGGHATPNGKQYLKAMGGETGSEHRLEAPGGAGKTNSTNKSRRGINGPRARKVLPRRGDIVSTKTVGEKKGGREEKELRGKLGRFDGTDQGRDCWKGWGGGGGIDILGERDGQKAHDIPFQTGGRVKKRR